MVTSFVLSCDVSCDVSLSISVCCFFWVCFFCRWKNLCFCLRAAESGHLFVLVVFSISTILNAYYLMEIPARAFFLKKDREIKVKMPTLITIPIICTCFLTIILFFAMEPFQKLTSIMVN